MLETKYGRQQTQEHGQNHAGNGECEGKLIDIITYGHILAGDAQPAFPLPRKLIRLLLLLQLRLILTSSRCLVIVVEHLSGRLHAEHLEGTPIELEANVFEDLLHRGALVCARG